MKKILGVDFGLKHIGLAMAESALVEPMQTLEINDMNDGLKKLLAVTEKQEIKTVVFGLVSGEMGKKIKQFASNFGRCFNGSIFFQDETLTSYEARQNVVRSGKKKTSRKTKAHQFAACYILQSFVDDHPECLYNIIN